MEHGADFDYPPASKPSCMSACSALNSHNDGLSDESPACTMILGLQRQTLSRAMISRLFRPCARITVRRSSSTVIPSRRPHHHGLVFFLTKNTGVVQFQVRVENAHSESLQYSADETVSGGRFYACS